MINILITGINSYVGCSYEKWIEQWPDKYKAKKISLREESWKSESFAKYDAILHVAGIAHVKLKENQQEIYYKINRDLTIEVAKKAKQEGVKQFIFLSSMSVYGESNGKNPHIVVTKETKPKPVGAYGNSKLQAEQRLLELEDEKFKIVIMRPPMIYGKDSIGNFTKLVKLAKITPIFPEIENQRSVIYIDNLCELIRLIIENKETGIFHPQDNEYMNTSEVVKHIAECNGKKMILIPHMKFVMKYISRHINMLNKIFGTFIYDKNIDKDKSIAYCKFDLRSSVKVCCICNHDNL